MKAGVGSALAMMAALAGVSACGGEASRTAPPRSPTPDTTTTSAAPDNEANPTAQLNSTLGYSPASGTSTPGPSAEPEDTTPQTVPPPGGSAVHTTGATLPIAPSVGLSGAESLDDGQIVAVVQAAGTAGIEQAHEALRRTTDARVARFAREMIRDQSVVDSRVGNLNEKAGIAARSSGVAEQLRSDGVRVLGSLHSSRASDFDGTYIDAQVVEQGSVLDLLDRWLIPGAQNVSLERTLRELRSKVAAHLNAARETQASLPRR